MGAVTAAGSDGRTINNIKKEKRKRKRTHRTNVRASNKVRSGGKAGNRSCR